MAAIVADIAELHVIMVHAIIICEGDMGGRGNVARLGNVLSAQIFPPKTTGRAGRGSRGEAELT